MSGWLAWRASLAPPAERGADAPVVIRATPFRRSSSIENLLTRRLVLADWRRFTGEPITQHGQLT